LSILLVYLIQLSCQAATRLIHPSAWDGVLSEVRIQELALLSAYRATSPYEQPEGG
jgi:hypothetical protein